MANDEIDYTSFDNDTLAGQLLMFIGEPGGVGKSRVLDALQGFCVANNGHPNAIIIINKTAMTGKAGVVIGGRTLHSFLLSLKSLGRQQHSTATASHERHPKRRRRHTNLNQERNYNIISQ